MLKQGEIWSNCQGVRDSSWGAKNVDSLAVQGVLDLISLPHYPAMFLSDFFLLFQVVIR